jgi:hypothetical protein
MRVNSGFSEFSWCLRPKIGQVARIHTNKMWFIGVVPPRVNLGDFYILWFTVRKVTLPHYGRILLPFPTWMRVRDRRRWTLTRTRVVPVKETNGMKGKPCLKLIAQRRFIGGLWFDCELIIGPRLCYSRIVFSNFQLTGSAQQFLAVSKIALSAKSYRGVAFFILPQYRSLDQQLSNLEHRAQLTWNSIANFFTEGCVPASSWNFVDLPTSHRSDLRFFVCKRIVPPSNN